MYHDEDEDEDEELSPLLISTLLLVARFNDKFLELAALLRQLYETAPEDFASVAKIRALGKRKAYYLVQIDRAFRDLGVSHVRLNKIGWTKLSIIAPVVTSENVEHWLTQAESFEAGNLKLLVKGEPPIVGVKQVLLRLSPSQFDVFVKVVIGHGGQQKGDGYVGKEEALTKALLKYLDPL